MSTFLVTSMPPATGGIRTSQQAIFNDVEGSTGKDLAQAEAERLLLADYTDVKVWKLHSTPSVQQTIAWTTATN